ncbi:DUF6879 family protein [Nocardia yunnanensis]|uniref:DUF6879 family protein n=1 Tax=Nocardia yunnanensis TaxID=2382165 RepID=UPI001FE7FFB6|nr:DUF6879 family protein [Nocardia yunnanensis]
MDFRPTIELLREARHDAFHLEVRDEYGVAGEDEPFQRFLNGEPFDYREWFRDWSQFVQDLTAHRVSVSRLRVLSVPHSDYQRWSLTIAPMNVEAGEDVRYLPRHLAGTVPPDDFWVIDNKVVVFGLADKEGRSPGGAAVSTDPELVAYCQRTRERLWNLATPLAEYVQLTRQ